jgi:hypothetical protein
MRGSASLRIMATNSRLRSLIGSGPKWASIRLPKQSHSFGARNLKRIRVALSLSSARIF